MKTEFKHIIKDVVNKYAHELDCNDYDEALSECQESGGMQCVLEFVKLAFEVEKRKEKCLSCNKCATKEEMQNCKMFHNVGNFYYDAENSVLYNAKRDTLAKYDENNTAKTFNIPATVTTLFDEAFENSQIEYIELPDNIKHIGSRAFRGCKKFTEILDLGRPASAGSHVFENCPRLKRVNVKDVDILWNVFADNFSSPFINKADLYENHKLVKKLSVPNVNKAHFEFFKGCQSIEEVDIGEHNPLVERAIISLIKD